MEWNAIGKMWVTPAGCHGVGYYWEDVGDTSGLPWSGILCHGGRGGGAVDNTSGLPYTCDIIRKMWVTSVCHSSGAVRVEVDVLGCPS